jgi:hypothetical protein
LKIPRCGFDQRDALAAELEPAREIGGIENAASKGSEPVDLIESR